GALKARRRGQADGPGRAHRLAREAPDEVGRRTSRLLSMGRDEHPIVHARGPVAALDRRRRGAAGARVGQGSTSMTPLYWAEAAGRPSAAGVRTEALTQYMPGSGQVTVKAPSAPVRTVISSGLSR